jgi:hypothetical protein
MSDENRWGEQRGLDANTQRLQSQPRREAELGGERTADLGYASSASAWRPTRYSASISCSHARSR